MSASRRARQARADRILPGALVALAALGIAAAAPAAPRSIENVQQQSKEYAPTQKAEKQKKKKQSIGGKPRGEGWTWYRNGDAIDGVGNFRSAKRLRRQVFIRLAGVPDTGRQWNHLRRLLRRHAPNLLAEHPRDLMRYAKRIGV
jgi:hypothetical protein